MRCPLPRSLFAPIESGDRAMYGEGNTGMVDLESAWARFWSQGTWWKALLLVAVYWGVYQLIGLGVGSVFHAFVDPANPLSNPASIFFSLALPILLAGLCLVLFAWSVGWLGELFARQPVRGQGWMWLAVVLVLIPIILRLVGTNWSAYSVGVVLALLFVGLCVGFAEELLTRGLVVSMLRKGGHGERLVLIVSALLFALLHVGNAVTGQAFATVAITVVYTFGFGAMMYLSLRITGRLVWVILLHAATDPITILATGGIDAHSETGSTSSLITFAGLFNIVYILLALVAIFLVKNRAEARAK